MMIKGKLLLYEVCFFLLITAIVPVSAFADSKVGIVSANGDVTIQQFQEEVLHSVRTKYKSNWPFGYDAYDTTESYTTIYFMNGYAFDHTSTSTSPTYGSFPQTYYYQITTYYYRTW